MAAKIRGFFFNDEKLKIFGEYFQMKKFIKIKNSRTIIMMIIIILILTAREN